MKYPIWDTIPIVLAIRITTKLRIFTFNLKYTHEI